MTRRRAEREKRTRARGFQPSKELIVARGSLRRYDTQAKWSLWISLLSAVMLIMLAGLEARNFKPDLKVIVFGKHSPYQWVVLGTVAVTILLSTVGLLLGINSAGQRRNELQKHSWAGFFIGTGVLSLALILFVAFWEMKLVLGE
jgi:amino acid transporter